MCSLEKYDFLDISFQRGYKLQGGATNVKGLSSAFQKNPGDLCVSKKRKVDQILKGLYILGSLSNHDDDGNKNPTNLHIWQWKTVFLHALHVHFFIFWHFVDVLVLSTTWNDHFCRCVDDVSVWWQMFNFVFSCPKRLFQFNSRIVRTHFSSIMSLNNWKMIAETRSHIFRWRSRFRRRRVCLSSLFFCPIFQQAMPFLIRVLQIVIRYDRVVVKSNGLSFVWWNWKII